MHTFHLTVDADGRVTIPDTRPGQTVTIQIADTPEPMTLATATTPEERDQVIAEIRQLGQEIRRELGDDDERLSLTHGDLLYDENGFPK